jgi:hypothetical protein
MDFKNEPRRRRRSSLKNETHQQTQASDFDPAVHLEFDPDVAQSDSDRTTHDGRQGFAEHQEYLKPPPDMPVHELPSDFAPAVYLELNPDVAQSPLDPATHYVQQGIAEHRQYRKQPLDTAVHEMQSDFAPAAYVDLNPDVAQADRGANDRQVGVKRAIAFYLPQFYPIPENDDWWGKNFTEWRNVALGQPQFEGHVQPNLPGELGYYDLRVPEVQRQQVALAKKYGLYGFCFYYYWFDGKRLLEYPLDRYVRDSEIDFPFCIWWANETWSRRWDGGESEILMKQVYSADGSERIFRDFLQYLVDPRYIEIDGKKIILIYRPNDIPDIHIYADTWRLLAREYGFEVMICACLTFGSGDPTPQGLDAAVQFPPHGVMAQEVTRARKTAADFTGNIYSYPSVVAGQLADAPPTFPLFRTVMPSWDNTARRKERACIYTDHSPELFSIWLSDAFEKSFTDDKGNRYVFINAWNEWAEGAYLEPDVQNGLVRLEALKFAVEGGGRADFALRVLDELAKSTNGTVGGILTHATAVLAETITAGRTLLAELRALVLREHSPYEIFAPVLPTDKPFLASDRAVFLPGALGAVDRLGTGVFENGMRIKPGRTLYVSGWVLPPTPDLARQRSHVLVIATGQSGQSFFFESERVRERWDVADHLTDWPREHASRSGFELNLAIEDVPPGTYLFTVGVACGSYVYLLSQVRRNTMVLAAG